MRWRLVLALVALLSLSGCGSLQMSSPPDPGPAAPPTPVAAPSPVTSGAPEQLDPRGQVIKAVIRGVPAFTAPMPPGTAMPATGGIDRFWAGAADHLRSELVRRQPGRYYAVTCLTAPAVGASHNLNLRTTRCQVREDARALQVWTLTVGRVCGGASELRFEKGAREPFPPRPLASGELDVATVCAPSGPQPTLNPTPLAPRPVTPAYVVNVPPRPQSSVTDPAYGRGISSLHQSEGVRARLATALAATLKREVPARTHAVTCDPLPGTFWSAWTQCDVRSGASAPVAWQAAVLGSCQSGLRV